MVTAAPMPDFDEKLNRIAGWLLLVAIAGAGLWIFFSMPSPIGLLAVALAVPVIWLQWFSGFVALEGLLARLSKRPAPRLPYVRRALQHRVVPVAVALFAATTLVRETGLFDASLNLGTSTHTRFTMSSYGVGAEPVGRAQCQPSGALCDGIEAGLREVVPTTAVQVAHDGGPFCYTPLANLGSVSGTFTGAGFSGDFDAESTETGFVSCHSFHEALGVEVGRQIGAQIAGR